MIVKMGRERERVCVSIQTGHKGIQSTCGQVNHFKATTVKGKLQKNSKKSVQKFDESKLSKQRFKIQK